MKRRNFLAGAAGATILTSASEAQAPGAKPVVIELRRFQLRNSTDNQRGRLTEWINTSAIPAFSRAGANPVGAFASSVAADTPFILFVSTHASLAAYEQNMDKVYADEKFMAEYKRFFESPGLPFQRVEVQLLRAFDGFPKIEVPAAGGGKPGIFEIRVYESNTPLSLAKKVKMFEEGEIDIFRKTGLLPVFFGRTIVGQHMPNLTYMLRFDSLAAREANWRAFATSPEWKKLVATPGYSDGELVSNITNMLVSPLAGSMIK